MGAFKIWSGCAATLLALTCAPPLLAQDSSGGSLAEQTTEHSEPAVAPTAPVTIIIPRLTEVMVEVVSELSSNTTVRGHTFPIRLIMPVVINGVEVIPAGTEGVGEIVHAKRNGGMGIGGELLLTARQLEYGGQPIELRSFRMGTEVQERINTVNTILIVSAATMPIASLVGFFIKGDALIVPAGTPALARLTFDETIVLAPPEAAPDGALGRPNEVAIVGEIE